MFLNEHPLCADCGHAATEVHHKIDIRQQPGLRLDPTNLESLCKACHSTRTGRGRGA